MNEVIHSIAPVFYTKYTKAIDPALPFEMRPPHEKPVPHEPEQEEHALADGSSGSGDAGDDGGENWDPNQPGEDFTGAISTPFRRQFNAILTLIVTLIQGAGGII